ncbi:MAG: penicillin acylase family protein [Opitutaceae bacterium]|nr:penicillin acylase family protein [Opitutaceae bacterium]
MKPPLNKFLRLLGWLVLVLAVCAAATGWWLHRQLQRSLPQLDGTVAVAGLAQPVTVERDALGVPTLTGANRTDLARALGWLHAQDRYFQMDLQRRSAAGELAELFGAKAVPADQAVRIHGFRRAAQTGLARLEAGERALLEAYAAGVNAGLQALTAKPFEYTVLRAEPAPWRPEDSLLVASAMALQLHDAGAYELSLGALRDAYGMEAVEFFAPVQTTQDAALDGTVGQPVPPPPARTIDLRRQKTAGMHATLFSAEPVAVGSNSFALGGDHTAAGVPLLASDMHLNLQVPNTWYRAVLAWEDGTPHRVVGVTLPGLPLVIAGSNGRVAWGFTNAYADTADLVIVETSAASDRLYKLGADLVRFDTRTETINVKGGKPVEHSVDETVWGPVLPAATGKRTYALRWNAHAADAINLHLLAMETAGGVDDAIAVAHRAGMPAQNLLVVDRAGHLAWTIAGQLPRRIGYDGRLPAIWTYGDRRWDGHVPPDEIPVLRQPAAGRLWTANNRLVGEPGLNVLGDGGYDQPARASRIRDRLFEINTATPADLLAVQLDDRTPLLDRWHELMLASLPADDAGKRHTGLRQALADWTGRATVDSVSYRLVRDFRRQVAQRVFEPIFAPCRQHYAGFNWQSFSYEQPLWTLLTERPEHFLNPEFSSWDDLLRAAVDGVLANLKAADTPIAEATWGERNRARIVHPFSRVLPRVLTNWLNMPADPLPGDTITPRVQTPTFGASERFVIAPGREAEGLFHMPGGQSGHPRSPFYRAGHDAWVRGEPTPLLPGPAQHTLTLEP